MEIIIKDMTMLIYDINNIAPRTNSYISTKLGLNYINMNRKNFITYNFIKLDEANYLSADRLNIIISPNYNNFDNQLTKDDKNNFYKFYHQIFNNKMIDLTHIVLNIINQQTNKQIRQCELSKLLNLGKVLDKNNDFTNNITQLMEQSNMVKRIIQPKKTFIELSTELKYIAQPYNDSTHKFASKFEAYIASFLDKHNIDYIYQYKYKDCKDKNTLPFDFLIKYNDDDILLEYDGKQHDNPISIFGGEEGFKLRKKHDKIKNDYCKDNNIPLLRINSTKTEYIDNELNEFLLKHNK